MKVTIDNLRVVGKDHKQGVYKSGPSQGQEWERYEVECSNGEGKSIVLACSKSIYEIIEPFKPYTGEAQLWKSGFKLDGELTDVFED